MQRPTSDVRIDLHVHSSHSNAPYSWFLRTADAAECYTPPEKAYEICKKRGMDLVTLTDHDTIDGALELRARYPDDTFISEEVSARFPEDGCVVHTIALDISEAQHAEIQRLRRNIYELVLYMREERIPYFWCHPLSQVNQRLEQRHIERCFLMFDALELRNGTRDEAHESRLRNIVRRLTPALLARWAERHPRTPTINLSGEYAFTGGSDDHGSIAIARAYTTFEGPATVAGLRDAMRCRRTEPGGDHGHAATLAHNCYGVMAGYFKSGGQVAGTSEAHAAEQGPSASMTMALGKYKYLLEQHGFALDADRLWREGHRDGFQNQLREAVDGALITSWRAAFDRIAGALSRGRVADVADVLPELAKTAMAELPYLLASRYHVRDRTGALRFTEQLGFGARIEKPHVAVMTDTIDEINGVALGLRRLQAEARRWAFRLDLVNVHDGKRTATDDDGVVRLPRVFGHRLREYPEYLWSIPHLPSLLRYLADERVDLVQCSTPGPVGVAGLVAARITGVPVIGQFHTDVPEYALRLTGDPTAAGFVRQLVGWFYRQMDRVLVPSRHVAELVVGLGVDHERVVEIPRGIDLSLFSPQRRRPDAYAQWGLGSEPKLLYVGRISREKSLDCLIDCFRAVSLERPDVRLVFVGDGPYTEPLRAMAGDPRVVFTGPITGERLAELYASADLFLFPSETETFGNAVVEAQASGLPVIVSDRGAAREHVIEGITGHVVDAREPAELYARVSALLASAELRAEMGADAANHARRYRMEEAVHGTFRTYARILGAAAQHSTPRAPHGSPSESPRVAHAQRLPNT